MRHASRTSLALLAFSAVAVGASTGLLLLPALRESDERTAECGRLLSQVSRFDAIAAERDRMRAELAAVDERARRVLRAIPGGPEQAHLMRMLALPTGPDMGTQTIVAGDPLPASMRGDEGYRAVPVTVEMQASFERVMEVLLRAEGDRRLVRPIRVEITRAQSEGSRASRAAQSVPAGFVEARIEVDAVYGDAAGASEGEQP